MTKTKKLAVGAVLSALGTAMVLLGSVVDVLDLSAVALASICVVAAVIELRGAYPWCIYAVTAVLALLLCPSKVTAVEYIAFGGIYPILKAALERLHPVVSWAVKLSYFNTALALTVFASVYVLGLPDTGFGYTLAVFALGNGFFVLYDIALSKLITLYMVVLRKRLRLGDYFEK